MRPLFLALALLPGVAAVPAMFADAVPYGNIGTPAPYKPIFAASTGTVTLYYVTGGQTGALDTLIFKDVTSGLTSTSFFPNQGNTASGATATFAVTAGDLLSFTINNFAYSLSSNPALNPDGYSHSYVTSFSGGTTLGSTFVYPSGLFVGMEDIPINTFSDYNDLDFIITNATTASPVPEPATLSLFATGLLGAAGFARRKFLNR